VRRRIADTACCTKPRLAEGGPSRQAIECEFDGVLHRFAVDSLDRIELAHAITVHKAQGNPFALAQNPDLRVRELDVLAVEC
jgi:hypothetical protein